MKPATIPVYVLTGFLGSGKTTLLNLILQHAKEAGLKPALLMNEIGDANVEGQVIGKDIPMSELLGGCICCTSRGDLGLELVQLAQEHKPDMIWIESTGVAHPLEIMEGITEASLYAGLTLHNVITVVDSRQLLDRMRIGSGKTYRLMQEQIRMANLLVLNKMELVQTSDLVELREALEGWNPYARIVATTKSELDPGMLYTDCAGVAHLNDLPQTFREQDDPAAAHDDHNHVHALTYFFKGSVDSHTFERFLRELPDEVYRAKGIVKFQDTANLFLFQYAYREVDFIGISPEQKVNCVAVLIGEGFSQSEMMGQLESMDVHN